MPSDQSISEVRSSLLQEIEDLLTLRDAVVRMNEYADYHDAESFNSMKRHESYDFAMLVDIRRILQTALEKHTRQRTLSNQIWNLEDKIYREGYGKFLHFNIQLSFFFFLVVVAVMVISTAF